MAEKIITQTEASVNPWRRNRGKQPVADGVLVEVRARNGKQSIGDAKYYKWNATNMSGKLIITSSRLAEHKIIKGYAEKVDKDVKLTTKATAGSDIIQTEHYRVRHGFRGKCILQRWWPYTLEWTDVDYNFAPLLLAEMNWSNDE